MPEKSTRSEEVKTVDEGRSGARAVSATVSACAVLSNQPRHCHARAVLPPRQPIKDSRMTKKKNVIPDCSGM